MTPFVFGTTEPSHSQDRNFPVPSRQCGLVQYVTCEYEPSTQQLRVISESRENVVHAAVTFQILQKLSRFPVPFRIWYWIDSWLLRFHVQFLFLKENRYRWAFVRAPLSTVYLLIVDTLASCDI